MTDPTPRGPSRLVRDELIHALRNGSVPRRGLDLVAVGTERFSGALDEELARVARGGAQFKAIRGEYGAGKSFMARWFQQRALAAGFAVAEVQMGQVDMPLYQLETVYRRAAAALRTRDWETGAFRAIVQGWLLSLEDAALAAGAPADDPDRLGLAVERLLEQRLAAIHQRWPAFGAALRACYRAMLAEDHAAVEALLSWLMASPQVGATAVRGAGLRGSIDHTGALSALQALLILLQQTGRPGLMLVLDEVETLQRLRSEPREKSLDTLRKLIDELSANAYPGLYLLITGTPAFFEGPRGVRSLPPLAQRLFTDFGPDPAFDSARAPQVRLLPFDEARLLSLGQRVRALYPASHPDRVHERVTDAVLARLAAEVMGPLASSFVSS
jgi:hypothetical protein